jgi:hypothetical protein
MVDAMSDAASPVRPPLLRTHLANDDLAWVPLSVRAAAELMAAVAFAVVSGLVVAVVVALYLATHVLWYGAFFLGIIPAAYQLRNRIAHAAMRRRMQRHRRDAADLPASGGRTAGDGELVRIRGRIRAQNRISALVDKRPVVFRRLAFRFYSLQVVHEAGCDFLVDDGSGEPVLIVIDGARLVADDAGAESDRPLDPEVLDRLEALDPPPALQDYFNDWRIDMAQRGLFSPAAGNERVLCEGDSVEVVGYRCRVVDPSVTSRLERDTPYRAALQGSAAMPLLMASAED